VKIAVQQNKNAKLTLFALTGDPTFFGKKERGKKHLSKLEGSSTMDLRNKVRGGDDLVGLHERKEID